MPKGPKAIVPRARRSSAKADGPATRAMNRVAPRVVPIVRRCKVAPTRAVRSPAFPAIATTIGRNARRDPAARVVLRNDRWKGRDVRRSVPTKGKADLPAPWTATVVRAIDRLSDRWKVKVVPRAPWTATVDRGIVPPSDRWKVKVVLPARWTATVDRAIDRLSDRWKVRIVLPARWTAIVDRGIGLPITHKALAPGTVPDRIEAPRAVVLRDRVVKVVPPEALPRYV